MKPCCLFLIPLLMGDVAAVDFPSFNPAPQNWLDARERHMLQNSGQSTLIFVFTRDCGNCHRSHRFLNQMQVRYGKRVRFVGVHSPEFRWEKDETKLRAYVRDNGLTYPIYLDPELNIWRQLDNRYWPAFYLFDKSGGLIRTFIGETHPGDQNARAIEDALKNQWAE